jgi:hypothetical protein
MLLKVALAAWTMAKHWILVVSVHISCAIQIRCIINT